MQKIFIFSLLILAACSSNQVAYPKAENAFDAGREFIDGTLKGDFKKAASYMLTDSVNQQFLILLEKEFRQKDKEGRQQLRTASINIQEVRDLDSVTSIILFHNSFDKKEQSIKVIKEQNSWLVDYKYSFQNKSVN